MTDEKVPAGSRLGVAFAIAINLIPLAGVVFWGWDAFALIFLFWLENVVIGVRTLCSMLANALVTGGMNMAGALFFGVFFTFHYGLFCFVHGTFVIALFGSGVAGDSMLDLVKVAQTLFAQQANLAIGFASIVLWQAVQFVLFLVRGEVRKTNPLSLMGAPYPRIIVLHIAIIGGGALLMALDQPVAGLVVLVLMKMAFDVSEALGKGPKFGEPPPTDASGPRLGGSLNEPRR